MSCHVFSFLRLDIEWKQTLIYTWPRGTAKRQTNTFLSENFLFFWKWLTENSSMPMLLIGPFTHASTPTEEPLNRHSNYYAYFRKWGGGHAIHTINLKLCCNYSHQKTIVVTHTNDYKLEKKLMLVLLSFLWVFAYIKKL